MCVPLLLLFFMSVDSFPLWGLLFFFFSVFTDKIHVPIGNFNIYILIYLGICIIKSFMKLAPAFFYFYFFFLQSTVTMFGSLLLPVPPPSPYKYPPVLGINKNCWIDSIVYFDFQGTSHISSSRMAGEIVRIACCPWKMATSPNTVILVSNFVNLVHVCVKLKV